MEALTGVSGVPAWMEIVGLFLCGVSFILSTYYGRKYHKAKEKIKNDNLWYEAVSENHRNRHEQYVKTISDLWKEVEQAKSERNEFYEGKIRSLNERIKKATDDNRGLSLHYAVMAGGSTDDITKAAKVFHRHLQGKE